MSRRRSTAYDAAALRLHPNGVRISTDDVTPVSSVLAKNKNARRHKDAKGRWIATDAGGDGKIVKRRKVDEGCTNGTAEPHTTESELGEGMPVRVVKDTRANRRLVFENDFTFLATSRLEGEGQPSSDFLKCIHHFTSRYYGSTDQLFDSGRQYRKEKKERKQRRVLQAACKETGSSQTRSSPGEENDSDTSDSVGKGKKKEEDKRRSGKRSPGKSETKKDMYKAFDGSALLCIGMLLQAQVSSSLVEQISDTWEDESEEYEENLATKGQITSLDSQSGKSLIEKPSMEALDTKPIPPC